MKKILATLVSTLCLCCLPVVASCSSDSETDNGSGTSAVAKYDVTFVGGEGATGEAVVKNAESGSSITLPENTFVKEGYEFAGWSDGTAEYQPGALYTVEGEKTFTAIWKKALVDFAVTAYPTAAAVTYGAKLSESALSGGAANVEGRFEWAFPETVPTVVNGGYNVKFVPTDTAYAEVILEQKVEITVHKQVVTDFALPTASAIEYGDKVGDSVLTGGAPFLSFAWENPDEVATACGTTSRNAVVTLTDENYELSVAAQTVAVNVEVQKRVLKVKASATVVYGAETPSMDDYKITYEGFVFEDDETVVSGTPRLGKIDYEKGAEGNIFYGELDVSGMSAENYTLQSMGADILMRVKLSFKVGNKEFFDVCEYGEQYEFAQTVASMPNYIITSYTRDGVTYNVGDKLSITAWEQPSFTLDARCGVELVQEDFSLTRAAKLYYGVGETSTPFAGIKASLRYAGSGNTGVQIEHAYYRALLKGVDYREYDSISFNVASNVALKLHTVDGTLILTATANTPHKLTVYKDGSLYVDGVDTGKDMVDGAITFDIDRSVNVYAELYISSATEVTGGTAITLAKENLFVAAIEGVGTMFATKFFEAATPEHDTEANIGYQFVDVKDIAVGSDSLPSAYYEFKISKEKVDYTQYDSVTFYLSINQGNYHELYCGGEYLGTFASHTQKKITVERDGTVFVDDVQTGGKLSGGELKFNILLVAEKEHTTSQYTTFKASSFADFVDEEVATLSASADGSKKIYASSTLEDVKEALNVIALFENGEEKTISGYEISGEVKAGECTFTVTYKEKSATVTVNVLAVETESVVATYTQSGTVYKTTALDDLKSDLVVKKIFNDGSEEITTDYELSGTLTAGESLVTVTCDGKTTTFSVQVTKVLTSISATYTQGEEKVYANTELNSLKGNLVVTAHFDNDSQEAVTEYALSGALTAGTSTITVTYEGKTATFTVDVATAEITGIAAEYTQGGAVVYTSTALDELKTSLTVTASYSDGTSKQISDYTLSGTLTAGESVVTVSYSGKTDTITVNVTAVAITAISAEYTQGDAEVYTSTALEDLKANLVVTATYNDGTSGEIAEYTLSGTLSVGESTVTVTAGEISDTFSVTVSQQVIALEKTDITLTAGSKLYYGIGTMGAGSECPFNALQASLQYSGSGNTGVKVEHAYYRVLLKGVDYRNYTSISFNVSSNVANFKVHAVDGTQVLSTAAKTAHKFTVHQDGSLYVDGVDTGKDMVDGAITFDLDRSVSIYAAFYVSTATEAVGGDAITIAKEDLFITAIEGVGKTFERKYIDAATPEKDTEANIGYKMDSVKEIEINGTKLPASYYELKISKDKIDYTKYESVTFYLSINQGNYHELYIGGEKLATFASHTQVKVTVKKDGTVYVNDAQTNAKLSGGELKVNILLVAEQEHTTSLYTQFKISDKVVVE